MAIITEKLAGYKLLEDLAKHVVCHMYTGYIMAGKGNNSHVKFSDKVAEALVSAGERAGRTGVLQEVWAAQAQRQIIAQQQNGGQQQAAPGAPQHHQQRNGGQATDMEL